MLQDELDRTTRELQLVSSPAARSAATRKADEQRGGEGGGGGKEGGKDMRKELAVAMKQVDEWRRKSQAAQEETKKMTRALAKELGDGVSIGA